MMSEYGELFTHEGSGVVIGDDTGRVMAKFSHEAEADSFCELVRDNERLQRENYALRANNIRLKDAVSHYSSELSATLQALHHCGFPENVTATEQIFKVNQFEVQIARLNGLINETPQQSLAEIEAVAVEKFMNIAEQYISGDQSEGLNNALFEFERQQGGE